jgi:hypothetical protein
MEHRPPVGWHVPERERADRQGGEPYVKTEGDEVGQQRQA